MTEVRHDGWLERSDDYGELDEVCVDAPVKFFHLERMDFGSWWMRLDLKDGRAIVVNIRAKRPSQTVVKAMVEED